MSNAVQSLPANYVLADEIDLAKNKKLALLLNLIGFVAFFGILWLLAIFVAQIRPGISSISTHFTINLATLGQVLLLFALILIDLVVHEFIHGFFFWFFTRSKPVFALHLEYAYAAAPTWYIPRIPYSLVALAPLILIGGLGLLSLYVIPLDWILLAILVIAFNTSGSIGDMLVISRLLRSSSACLTNDRGDGVFFYEPQG